MKFRYYCPAFITTDDPLYHKTFEVHTFEELLQHQQFQKWGVTKETLRVAHYYNGTFILNHVAPGTKEPGWVIAFADTWPFTDSIVPEKE